MAATGVLSAAEATTTPVGYFTQTLAQGFNVAGLTLQNSPVATGTFETVSGNALTDTGLTFAPVAGKTYVLEIKSGSQIGVVQEIPAASISGTTITTPDNLTALGLASGDSYSLRVAPTLEEIFTTTPLASGGVLTASLNIANSDVIWLPTGTGAFDKYFLRSGATPGFQRITGATTFVAASNVPVIYTDGFYIEKKVAASASLVVSGEVKTVGSNSVLRQGFNVLSVVAPAGLTLRTAGFDDDIAKAVNVANSDVIWVQQANLSYSKYYLHSTQGWRDAVTNINLPAGTDPVLGSAVLIERKSATSVAIDLNVPTSYSNL